MLYQVLARMIGRGDAEGLKEKINVLFAAGQITKKEYKALEELLKGGGVDD